MSDDALETRARFEKDVLASAPRLTLEDRFKFGCHPGVSCFGDCCGDVSIVLTPYDVYRLKKRLGMTSTEFIDQHTLLPFAKEQKIPAPLLKMGADEKKKCPFFSSESGCTVYEDRPWACRMYPLGYAAPAEGEVGAKAFWFLLEEEGCAGFKEPMELSVADWIEGQGIEEYDEWGEFYRRLAVDRLARSGRELDPKSMHMFFLATYDIDGFRRFVFESTFLTRFEVPAEEVERIRTDDEALMRFGSRWLSFSLFGEPTMKVKSPPNIKATTVPEREQ